MTTGRSTAAARPPAPPATRPAVGAAPAGGSWAPSDRWLVVGTAWPREEVSGPIAHHHRAPTSIRASHTQAARQAKETTT